MEQFNISEPTPMVSVGNTPDLIDSLDATQEALHPVQKVEESPIVNVVKDTYDDIVKSYETTIDKAISSGSFKNDDNLPVNSLAVFNAWRNGKIEVTDENAGNVLSALTTIASGGRIKDDYDGSVFMSFAQMTDNSNHQMKSGLSLTQDTNGIAKRKWDRKSTLDGFKKYFDALDAGEVGMRLSANKELLRRGIGMKDGEDYFSASHERQYEIACNAVPLYGDLTQFKNSIDGLMKEIGAGSIDCKDSEAGQYISSKILKDAKFDIVNQSESVKDFLNSGLPRTEENLAEWIETHKMEYLNKELNQVPFQNDQYGAIGITKAIEAYGKDDISGFKDENGKWHLQYKLGGRYDREFALKNKVISDMADTDGRYNAIRAINILNENPEAWSFVRRWVDKMNGEVPVENRIETLARGHMEHGIDPTGLLVAQGNFFKPQVGKLQGDHIGVFDMMMDYLEKGNPNDEEYAKRRKVCNAAMQAFSCIDNRKGSYWSGKSSVGQALAGFENAVQSGAFDFWRGLGDWAVGLFGDDIDYAANYASKLTTEDKALVELRAKTLMEGLSLVNSNEYFSDNSILGGAAEFLISLEAMGPLFGASTKAVGGATALAGKGISKASALGKMLHAPWLGKTLTKSGAFTEKMGKWLVAGGMSPAQQKISDEMDTLFANSMKSALKGEKLAEGSVERMRTLDAMLSKISTDPQAYVSLSEKVAQFISKIPAGVYFYDEAKHASVGTYVLSTEDTSEESLKNMEYFGEVNGVIEGLMMAGLTHLAKGNKSIISEGVKNLRGEAKALDRQLKAIVDGTVVPEGRDAAKALGRKAVLMRALEMSRNAFKSNAEFMFTLEEAKNITENTRLVCNDLMKDPNYRPSVYDMVGRGQAEALAETAKIASTAAISTLTIGGAKTAAKGGLSKEAIQKIANSRGTLLQERLTKEGFNGRALITDFALKYSEADDKTRKLMRNEIRSRYSEETARLFDQFAYEIERPRADQGIDVRSNIGRMREQKLTKEGISESLARIGVKDVKVEAMPNGSVYLTMPKGTKIGDYEVAEDKTFVVKASSMEGLHSKTVDGKKVYDLNWIDEIISKHLSGQNIGEFSKKLDEFLGRQMSEGQKEKKLARLRNGENIEGLLDVMEKSATDQGIYIPKGDTRYGKSMEGEDVNLADGVILLANANAAGRIPAAGTNGIIDAALARGADVETFLHEYFHAVTDSLPFTPEQKQILQERYGKFVDADGKTQTQNWKEGLVDAFIKAHFEDDRMLRSEAFRKLNDGGVLTAVQEAAKSFARSIGLDAESAYSDKRIDKEVEAQSLNDFIGDMLGEVRDTKKETDAQNEAKNLAREITGSSFKVDTKNTSSVLESFRGRVRSEGGFGKNPKHYEYIRGVAKSWMNGTADMTRYPEWIAPFGKDDAMLAQSLCAASLNSINDSQTKDGYTSLISRMNRSGISQAEMSIIARKFGVIHKGMDGYDPSHCFSYGGGAGYVKFDENVIDTFNVAARDEQKNTVVDWAKKNDCYYSDITKLMDDTGRKLKPIGFGAESEVWKDARHGKVVKHLAGQEMTAANDLSTMLDRVVLFNSIFPEAKMKVIGWGEEVHHDQITGEPTDKRFGVFVEQPYLVGDSNLSEAEVADYMKSKGFRAVYDIEKGDNMYVSEDNSVVIRDINQGNAVRYPDGQIGVIDAICALNTKQNVRDGVVQSSDLIDGGDFKDGTWKACWDTSGVDVSILDRLEEEKRNLGATDVPETGKPYIALGFHGTRSGGFTVFDPKMSDDKLTLFMAGTKRTAQSYIGGLPTTVGLTEQDIKSIRKFFQEEVEYYESMYGKDETNRDSWAKLINVAEENLRKEVESLNTEMSVEDIRDKIDVFDGYMPFVCDILHNATQSRKDFSVWNNPSPNNKQIKTQFIDILRANEKATKDALKDILLDGVDKDEVGIITSAIENNKNFDIFADNIRSYIENGNDNSKSKLLKAFGEDVYDKLASLLVKGSEGAKGIYNLAMRFDNPLVIDAKGSNWNNIKYEEDSEEVMSQDELRGNWWNRKCYIRGEIKKVAYELSCKLKDDSLLDPESIKSKDLDNLDYSTLDKFIADADRLLPDELMNNYYIQDLRKQLHETDSFEGWLNHFYGTTTPTKKISGNKATTRQLAKMASEQGYDGVIVQNCTDDGGRNNWGVDADTIYMQFIPEHVKMIDDITFDDYGKMIPVSERLNWDKNESRWNVVGERALTNILGAEEAGKQAKTIRETFREAFNALESDESRDSRKRIENDEINAFLESRGNNEFTVDFNGSPVKFKFYKGGADGKTRIEYGGQSAIVPRYFQKRINELNDKEEFENLYVSDFYKKDEVMKSSIFAGVHNARVFVKGTKAYEQYVKMRDIGEKERLKSQGANRDVDLMSRIRPVDPMFVNGVGVNEYGDVIIEKLGDNRTIAKQMNQAVVKLMQKFEGWETPVTYSNEYFGYVLGKRDMDTDGTLSFVMGDKKLAGMVEDIVRTRLEEVKRGREINGLDTDENIIVEKVRDAMCEAIGDCAKYFNSEIEAASLGARFGNDIDTLPKYSELQRDVIDGLIRPYNHNNLKSWQNSRNVVKFYRDVIMKLITKELFTNTNGTLLANAKNELSNELSVKVRNYIKDTVKGYVDAMPEIEEARVNRDNLGVAKEYEQGARRGTGAKYIVSDAGNVAEKAEAKLDKATRFEAGAMKLAEDFIKKNGVNALLGNKDIIKKMFDAVKEAMGKEAEYYKDIEIMAKVKDSMLKAVSNAAALFHVKTSDGSVLDGGLLDQNRKLKRDNKRLQKRVDNAVKNRMQATRIRNAAGMTSEEVDSYFGRDTIGDLVNIGLDPTAPILNAGKFANEMTVNFAIAMRDAHKEFRDMKISEFFDNPIASAEYAATVASWLNRAARKCAYGRVRSAIQRDAAQLRWLVKPSFFTAKNILTDSVRKMVELQSRMKTKTIIENIKKVIDKKALGSKVVKQNEEAYDRDVSPLVQEYWKSVKDCLEMTQEDVDAELNKLQNEFNFGETEWDEIRGTGSEGLKSLTEDQVKKRRAALIRVVALTRYGALKYKSIGELGDKVDEISNDITTHRERFAEMFSERIERDKRDVATLVDQLTKARANTTGATNIAISKGRAFLRGALYYNLPDLFLKLKAYFPKNSEAYNLCEEFRRDMSLAHIDQEQMISSANDAFVSAIQEIYGKEFHDVINELMTPSVEYAKFARSDWAIPVDALEQSIFVNGKEKKFKCAVMGGNPNATRSANGLSKAQLMYIYAACSQEDMMVNNAVYKRDAAYFREIADIIGPEGLAVIKWMREQFDLQRKAMSPICEAITGMPVVSPNDNYFSLKFEQAKDDPMDKRTRFSPNMFPSFLTNRKNHDGARLEERIDIFHMFHERMQDTAHYCTFMPIIDRVRTTFSNREVQTAYAKTIGEEAYKEMYTQLATALNGGKSDTIKWLAGLRNFTTASTLFYNIPSAIKQFEGIGGWSAEMGVTHWLKNIAAFNYGSREARDCAASIDMVLDTRKSEGFSDVARALKESIDAVESGHGTIRETYNKYKRHGLRLTEFIDRLASRSMAGAYFNQKVAYYRSMGDNMDDARQKALADVDYAIQTTQQSSRPEFQISAQRGDSFAGEFGKLFSQFAGPAYMRLGLELEALHRYIITKNDGNATKQDIAEARKAFIGKAVALHIICPSILTALECFGKSITHNPDDEDFLVECMNSWARNVLTGPFSGAFVLGSLAENAAHTLLGGRGTVKRFNVPMLSRLESLYKRTSNVFNDLRLACMGDLDGESLLRYTLDVIEALAPAARHVENATINIPNLLK